MTRVRDYRHRIQLQKLSTSSTGPGTRGQTTKSYSTLALVRGSIRQLDGEEKVLAREIHAGAEYEIGLHYTALVTPRTRLKFGTRIFHVEAVNNVDQRNRELRLTCREEVL